MSDSMTTAELLSEMAKHVTVLEELIRVAYTRSLRMSAEITESMVWFSDDDPPFLYPRFIMSYDIDCSRKNAPWDLALADHDDGISVH